MNSYYVDDKLHPHISPPRRKIKLITALILKLHPKLNVLLNRSGFVLSARHSTWLPRLHRPDNPMMLRRNKVRHRVSLGSQPASLRRLRNHDPVLRGREISICPDLSEIADSKVQPLLDFGSSGEECAWVQAIFNLEALVLVLEKEGECGKVSVGRAPGRRCAVDG